MFYFLKQKTKDKKYVGSMDINATFADLPAPELKWEEMAEAPVVRLDGAAIQIKNLLYVFAGYGTINDVRKNFTSSIVSFMHYISIYPFCFNYEIYSKKNTTLYLCHHPLACRSCKLWKKFISALHRLNI
jgi:hypothetical protein